MPEMLRTYEGETEGVLLGNKQEMLRDLMAVIEATQDKRVRLTKAGIPPKPLWTALNERVLWSDPKQILYDWDECDQVRFVYALADQLALITAGADRELGIGPGADLFFTALPTRRADMLLRAYQEIDDWDERCDARNEHGHRLNFGQTFRRDFMRETSELRLALLDGLSRSPLGEWVPARALAEVVSFAAPDILISEDDVAPDIEEGEADAEIERLIDYWLMLAARFGWVDLARMVERELHSGAPRLFRLTQLGHDLLHGDAGARDDEELAATNARRPYLVQADLQVMVYRDDTDIADEYLIRRLADQSQLPDWDSPVASYTVTPASVLNAIDAGLDPDQVIEAIRARSRTEVPSTFQVLLDDIVRKRDRVKLTRGLTAVELGDADQVVHDRLSAGGFMSFDALYLVPWDRWSEFVAALGEEPSEGFRYPPPEPLGRINGSKLRLAWPVLPLVSRDLLDVLKPDGDPLVADLGEDTLAELRLKGWNEKDIALAVSCLTGGTVPKRLQGALS